MQETPQASDVTPAPEVPAASRVLEAADLPLSVVLAALPLRPLALAASTCRLWHETSQELSLIHISEPTRPY